VRRVTSYVADWGVLAHAAGAAAAAIIIIIIIIIMKREHVC